MKIIGHRGARGVALENSLESIQMALSLHIDAIELDIHRTSDGALVVAHDATTGRVATHDVRITDVTLADLRQIPLRNGQQIPTLNQVLELAASKPLYIDIKDPGTAESLLALLQKYPNAHVTFVSRLADELRSIRQQLPDAQTYIYFLKAENPIPRPLHMVRVALSIKATGIGLDKLYLNPITYLLGRQRGLKLYSYSISSLWGARLLHRLYPNLDLCTSHPELLAQHFRKDT